MIIGGLGQVDDGGLSYCRRRCVVVRLASWGPLDGKFGGMYE